MTSNLLGAADDYHIVNVAADQDLAGIRNRSKTL